MSDRYEPPPMDYDHLEPPEDFYREDPWAGMPLDADYSYDPGLDFDPFPIPDNYTPDELRDLPDVPPLSQEGAQQVALQGFEQTEPLNENWSWHDARLIGVDHGEDIAEARYEIGAIDLYTDASTGDLGGSYLLLGSFTDRDEAETVFDGLQAQLYDEGLAPWQVPDFAEARSFAMNPEPQNWRSAEQAEYAAYDYIRNLDAFSPELADEPPFEAIDPLIQTAIELGGVVVEQEIQTEPEVDEAAFQALNAIGVQAENFDPTLDPPPFYDADTGTAYWIGVFQPVKNDYENCITSILSLGRDPETGVMEAQLAPCVPGDWDKAYSAAEYLIQVAQKGGIEQVFDTAEGMALATDQRELWENQRGLALESDAARDIADYTRDTWEMEL